MKIKKFFKKAYENVNNILFGILSGSGLIFWVGLTYLAIVGIFSISQNYSIYIFVAFFLLFFIPSLMINLKRWFKVTYIISSLTLFVYLFVRWLTNGPAI